MRICFISEAKSVHTQRWTGSLAQAGCNVHLISSSPARIDGVELHQLPIYSPNPLAQIRNSIRIRRLIYELKPDVVHLFGLFSVNSLGSMWLLKSWPHLVISVWGSDVVAFTAKESLKERFIKRHILQKGKCVVATSQYLAREVSSYVNQRQEVSVIPWGIEVDQFLPSQRETDGDRVIMGFAKRLEAISGADILFQAFRSVLEKTKKDLRLRIAGEGPMKPLLSSFAKENQFEDRVEWLGWVHDREEIVGFYKSIDVFVMPSRRESFGVAALEAAASGLPVIASRFGGIPEIVIHGQTGLLVEQEDVEGFARAILALIEDRDLRREMGLRGHKRVKAKYDWRTSISSMVELYQQVCLD